MMADFATDFFSHRWDFFKDPINRLLCSADDDDDDDGGGGDGGGTAGAGGGSGDDDNTGATFGGDARDTANYGDDDQSPAEATREADRAAGLGGGGSSGISSGGTPSGGQFGGDARDTGGYGDDDGLSPAEATRESNRADALGRLAGPAGGEDGASIRDMLLSAFGGAFSSPAAAGELPTEGMPNPNFNQGYNVTGLPAGMKDQSRLSNPNYNQGYNVTGTPEGLGQGPFASGPFVDPMSGGRSLTGTSPALTGDAPGLTPQQAAAAFGNPPVVGPGDTIIGPQNPVKVYGAKDFNPIDATAPDPVRVYGANEFNPIDATAPRQVASLSDRFRDPQQPEPLRADDPLPEGGTWGDPLTPRGSSSTLSDISTGGYARNQGPFAPSLLDQLAQQYGGFDHQYTTAREQNDPPGPKDRS
jgi:hypothetical protein